MKDWHVRLKEEDYHKMTIVAEVLFNDDGKQGKQARALKEIIAPVIEEKYQEALKKKVAE